MIDDEIPGTRLPGFPYILQARPGAWREHEACDSQVEGFTPGSRTSL